MEALLQGGADVNVRCKPELGNQTALEMATMQANVGCISLLSQPTPRSSPSSIFGVQAEELVSAIMLGEHRWVRRLLSLPSQVDVNDYLPPTQTLRMQGLDEKATMLLCAASVFKVGHGNEPKRGQTEIVLALIGRRADVDKGLAVSRQTPLMIACRGGAPDIALLLIQHGAQINYQTPPKKQFNDKEGSGFALMSVCKVFPHQPTGETLSGSTLAHHVTCIQLLLAHRGQVDMQDAEGYTPLLCCCERGLLDLAEILLQHHADINHSGAHGMPGYRPLCAAMSQHHQQIVKILVQAGADTTTLCGRRINLNGKPFNMSGTICCTKAMTSGRCAVKLDVGAEVTVPLHCISSIIDLHAEQQQQQESLRRAREPGKKASWEQERAWQESLMGLRNLMSTARAQSERDAVSKAHLLRQAGNEAFNKKQIHKALDIYSKALELLWPFESVADVARALVLNLSNHAQACNSVGRFQEAIEDCDAAFVLLARRKHDRHANHHDDSLVMKKLQWRRKKASEALSTSTMSEINRVQAAADWAVMLAASRMTALEAKSAEAEPPASAVPAVDQPANASRPRLVLGERVWYTDQGGLELEATVVHGDQSLCTSLDDEPLYTITLVGAEGQERSTVRDRLRTSGEARRAPPTPLPSDLPPTSTEPSEPSPASPRGMPPAYHAPPASQPSAELVVPGSLLGAAAMGVAQAVELSRAEAEERAEVEEVQEREQVRAMRLSRRQARQDARRREEQERADREIIERVQVQSRTEWSEQDNLNRQMQREREARDADELQLVLTNSHREAQTRLARDAQLSGVTSEAFLPNGMTASATDEEDHPMCAVCLEDDARNLIQPCSTCNTYMHLGCATQWRNQCRSGANCGGSAQEPTCPICRAPF